jgi:transcriptional regulator with XRE-family HTH domain
MRVDEINAAIARRLGRRREALGISVPEVAERCGLSEQAVRGYESGAVAIPAAILQLLSEALHTSVSYFYEGAPAPFRPVVDLAELSDRR